ncbi:TetR/AcrR family transcriptional regulator [Gordonia aurantiaca]|uniref:TetR/AcrR family transcriptional regulator n=1 Tax=Gordonia sp. B21 TaxID=3151852 RepID=UPI0032667991
MPATRSQRAEQIIRAATELFTESGYRNVSIEQIGAAVGLTGPAVYRHFTDKHEILVQALRAQIDLVARLHREAEMRGRTPEEALRLFLDGLGDLTANHHVSILWRREQRHLHRKQFEEMRGIFTGYGDYIAGKIAALRPDLSSDDARLLGFTVLSLYSNTNGTRGRMTPNRLMQVQRAVVRSVIDCALPRDDAAPGAAAASRTRTWSPAGRRERILDAAADLFAQRGFHDVRIDDIAHAADVSVATFYQLVPGKTEVLHAILVRGTEGMLYDATRALARCAPGEELDTLVATFIGQMLSVHGRIVPIYTRDSVYLPEEARAELTASSREHLAEWIAALRARVASLTHDEADTLANLFIGVIGDIVSAPDLRARPLIGADLTALANAILLPADVVGRP